MELASDGSFEFSNLPSGKYEIFPSVRGYCLQDNQRVLETTVDRDMDKFSVAVEPVVGDPSACQRHPDGKEGCSGAAPLKRER